MKNFSPSLPVQLPVKTKFERGLQTLSQVALVLIGFCVLVAALSYGKFLLAPIFTAVVIGLMFGPIALRLEKYGVPPALSALFIIFLFLGLLLGGTSLLANPLSEWIDKAPALWEKFRAELSVLKEPLEAVRDFGKQVKAIASPGSTNMTVTVEDGSTVKDIVTIAPAVIGQILIFLASLYFFIATRAQFRTSVLMLFYNRRTRRYAARMFSDIEDFVSRYLLSITLINAGQGLAVSLAMLALGMPSPVLWGAMAFVLNYVVYIGPAIMTAILVAVGLSSMTGFLNGLLPAAVFLLLHAIEGQFVTPHVIGRTMTMNPFIVFLSIAFWIWIWGPIGGFIAVPFLLVCYAVSRNLLPQKNVLSFPTVL